MLLINYVILNIRENYGHEFINHEYLSFPKKGSGFFNYWSVLKMWVNLCIVIMVSLFRNQFNIPLGHRVACSPLCEFTNYAVGSVTTLKIKWLPVFCHILIMQLPNQDARALPAYRRLNAI